MMPPRASISRTRWPLPIPPTAGLHDICPMRSRLRVRRAVLAPSLAAAEAASQPAWPPPITITSKYSSNTIGTLSRVEGTQGSHVVLLADAKGGEDLSQDLFGCCFA